MVRIVRGFIAGLVLVVASAVTADAAMMPFQIHFPFTDPSSAFVYTQFEVDFVYDTTGGLTQVTIQSDDIDLSAFTEDDATFGQSAPIGVNPIIPPGGAVVAAFKMPAISSTAFTFDPVSGTTFAAFGSGIFAIEGLGDTLCSSPSPNCWMSAAFTNATLQIQTGLPINFFGDVSFYDGPIFVDTGLENPGRFEYALTFASCTQFDQAQRCTNMEFTALGNVQATVPQQTPVPEPATMSLLGGGLAAGAFRAWRKRRK